MTSATDGYTHTITAAGFDAGIWQGQGRYQAACGREVMAASLMSGPGPHCHDCPPLSEDDSARSGLLVAALATLSGFGGLLRDRSRGRAA